MPAYLLINHVPFGRSKSPGHVLVGDLWLQDLKAQAQSVRDAGMRLLVATPIAEQFNPADGGSFTAIDVRPEDVGFEHLPLPYYKSMKGYIAARSELRRKLADAIDKATIVQADYGGYPIPLGSVAWPIAQGLHKRRIWLFDGGDPFPQWRFAARRDRNIVKRFAKLLLIRRFESFCHRAVRDADLVFVHNNAVVERFKNVWHERCHRFDRTFVTDEILISSEELQRRNARLLDRASPLRLVAAGRQIAIKGTDHVLRAMASAIARGVRVELEVLGDGDQLERYKRLCAELRLNDHVHFTGPVPYGKPLFDAWNVAHAMIVTNLTSEFSRNLLLSMARGLPLIMYSNAGDASVESKDLALTVPCGDEAALADALVEADRDRERLAAMAERGLNFAMHTTLQACHRRRAALAAAAISTGPKDRTRPPGRGIRPST